MNEKRAQIVARFAELLRGITIANGFLTDAGLGVYPWLKYRSSGAEDPIVLTYRDPRRSAGNVGNDLRGLGEENFLLDLEIEVIIADDDEETTLAHNVITDLRRAVGSDPTFSGVAEWTNWISDEIETEVGEAITSFVSASMQVYYVALDWAE